MQPEHISKVLEVLKAYERQTALIDALAKQVINTSKLNQIVESGIALDKFRKDIASAAALPMINLSLAMSAEAARTMSASLTGLGSYDKLLKRLAQSYRWIASLDAIGKISISAQLNQRLSLILQSNLLTEQAIARIATALSSVDAKIETEEKRKAALKELFRTMLHLLMTGQVRVKGYNSPKESGDDG